MSKNGKKQTVFVAMSGGVDSSVAAALLKKEGYDAVGVFMKCWDAANPFGKSCTAPDDERSARLAAEHLDIPFYSWNFVKEYKERVVDYMLKGYREGITPNPDVMCNREIKFGLFFEKAMALGADFIATGHYARLRRENTIHKTQSTNKSQIPNHKFQTNRGQERIFLLEGKDKNKDQSYFLGRIKPETLERVLFPIGNYTKPEVRKLARKFGLPNAERKESQGVCFVGKLDFAEFLRSHICEESGPIKDIHGDSMGKHQGLSLYTVGQRKRIGLSGGPYFVVGKEGKTNTLLVSKNEQDLAVRSIHVGSIHWLTQEKNLDHCLVKIRYRQKASGATVRRVGNTGEYEVIFKEKQRAPAAGQFAVFYDGEEVLASGIII